MAGYVDLDGYQVAGITKLAVLVVKGTFAVWCPRSVCEDGDELTLGDTDIRVAEWFADREGLDA